MCSYKRFLKRLFKKNLKRVAAISFSEMEQGEKSGADIWGTDFPIPTSDTLSYKIFKQDGAQYVVTSIESKILFFIPFHYDEYVIEIPWNKYSPGMFNANAALEEIHKAENWNKGGEMKPTYFEGDLSFVGPDKSFTYECGNNDYQWLKYN